jgi:hypothetical protein
MLPAQPRKQLLAALHETRDARVLAQPRRQREE